jgi:hypothetical protein
MLIITALHLFMISPIQQRYTRHGLMLYPIICIFQESVELVREEYKLDLSHWA